MDRATFEQLIPPNVLFMCQRVWFLPGRHPGKTHLRFEHHDLVASMCAGYLSFHYHHWGAGVHRQVSSIMPSALGFPLGFQLCAQKDLGLPQVRRLHVQVPCRCPRFTAGTKWRLGSAGDVMGPRAATTHGDPEKETPSFRVSFGNYIPPLASHLKSQTHCRAEVLHSLKRKRCLIHPLQ